MKKFLEMLTEEMQQAFTAAGYDGSLGKVMLSNRPDLCEYQCNGAMAGAKLYKKAPIMIANDVAEQLKDSKVFSEVVAVAPGFLNLKVSEAFCSPIYRAWKQMKNSVSRSRNIPRRSSSTMADPTWRSLCMWDIYVPQ